MRRAPPAAALAAALGAAALLGPRGARAADHEVYALSGAGYFGGVARVLVGVGGGVGYRVHPWAGLSLHAEARWLLYGGNAFAGALGALYALRVGAWAPAAGLQLVAYAGDQIRVVDAGAPEVPAPVNVGMQVRLAPLRVRRGRFTAAALVVDWGYAPERGRAAAAFTLSLLEIGLRL